ncbi:MAG TPA: DUF5947 family protein [Gemmatimonadales bacterium]|jgi:hypothetical protein
MIDTPALARLAQRAVPPAEPDPGTPSVREEECDLCAEPIGPAHRHLFEMESRQVLCVCTACRILFDRGAAGGGHYRLIPERRQRVTDFDLDDLEWEQLRIPVNVAFFAWSSAARRMVAMYPGALGAAESALSLDTWRELAMRNPIVNDLLPDVEAVLVDRAKAPHRYFIVPIDDCYRLTGVIRTQWKGFTGGKEVWREIDTFFDTLSRSAVTTLQRS